jgi:hypothetical protein
MTSDGYNSRASLNEHRARRFFVDCSYVDKLIREIAANLNSATTEAPFPKYIQHMSPVQRQTIEDWLPRIRAQLAKVRDGRGISRPHAWILTTRVVFPALTTIDIAVGELPFASFADGYRVQVERWQVAWSVGSEEEQTLLRDLRRLGGLALETEAGVSEGSAR